MKKALTILGALALTFGATQVHANNGHGKHRHGNHEHNNGYTYTDYARVTYVEPLYKYVTCLLYTSPSPRDATLSRMPSSA